LIYSSRLRVDEDILKDYKRAVIDLDRIIQLKPNASRYYSDRAYIKRYYLKDLLGALSDFNRAIEIEPYNSSYYGDRSKIKQILEDYDSALIDLNKAIKFGEGESSLPIYYRNRADLKESFLKDNQGALEDRQKASEVKFYPFFSALSIHYEHAEIKKDVYLKLLPKNDLAILRTPYKAGYYIDRAKLKAYYLDDLEGGFADFNKAIEIEPNNASHYTDRAVIKEYDLKDFDGALADYNKAIQLDPNDSFIYLRRACFRQNNSLDNIMILSDFNKAIRLDPNYHYLYEYRAEFKEKNLGDKQGAINDLRQKDLLELEIWRFQTLPRIRVGITSLK
jgi:tetratricopeptide (TPR) repeat protein